MLQMLCFFLRKSGFSFGISCHVNFLHCWLATKITLCITDLAINRILFKKCVILMQKTREYNHNLCKIAGFSVAHLAALCMAYIYQYDFSVNFTSLRHICLQSTISWQVDLVYRLLQHQGCVEIHCPKYAPTLASCSFDKHWINFDNFRSTSSAVFQTKYAHLTIIYLHCNNVKELSAFKIGTLTKICNWRCANRANPVR